MSKAGNTHSDGMQQRPEPIAIIGIGCLFPKAKDLGAYWANIKNGVDAITEIPESHWRSSDYFDANIKRQDFTYGTRGGFLPSVDFNPLEFGMPPNAIEATDTAQLLAMAAATHALKDAGYGPDNKDFNRDRVSVLLGVTGALELTVKLGSRLGHPVWRKSLKDAGVDDAVAEDVLQRISDSYPLWQENSFPGLLGNVVAGRITKHLDLGGTNCVVDAACASSHSAIHLACMELMAGRADMVLSGGVDAFNDIFMYMCFSKTPALSPSGHAKPFDADCDGTTLGEGLGMVVLKRLEDAERDGDEVYAVIRAMGTSSDGKGEAIYAPSSDGQVKALSEAYELAGVDPATIELLEAHGTGTKAGDAAELGGLSQVYGEAQNGPWCAIGSVKSQIGHAKAAAGIAGLIKAAMALNHKVLPPTIKVSQPQEAFTSATTPFYVNTTKRPWLPRAEHPRRAGVSAFGFGGSNFHCLLEEHDGEKKSVDWEGDVEILAFAADSAAGVVKKLDAIDGNASWETLLRQAHGLRKDFDASQPCRLALAIQCGETDIPKLIASARGMLDTKADEKTWSLPAGAYYSSGPVPGKLGFIFPGQGTQYVGMLNDLVCQFPKMLESLAMANEAFAVGKDASDKRLSDYIYALPAFDKETKKQQELELRAASVAPPSIGALSAGACKVLADFGLTPEAAAGHSYGELVALWVGGVYSEEDFHRLSKLRGELMDQGEGDLGSMMAVRAPLADVQAVLDETGLDLVVANKNAPNQAVISGDTQEIDKALAAFKERKMSGVKIPVAAAFHSKLVSHVYSPLLKALKKTELTTAKIPVFTNVTAEQYPDSADGMREILASQLARPVEFTEEIRNMYALGVRTFIEIGPGARMTALVKAILDDADYEAFALDASGGKRHGVYDLARFLAQLTSLGYPVDLSKWNEGLTPEADSKKARLTVPLCGANHMDPREAKAPVTKAAPAPVPAPAAAQAASVPSPAPLPQAAPTGMAEALKATQENMTALQKLQEHTAELHRQFLEGQQSAATTFQSLLAQQQRLLDTGGEAGIQAIAQATITPQPSPPPRAPAPVPVETQVPIAEPEPAPPQPAPVSGSQTQTVLLETIADKTGYPVEMLELDMALDADLGIDSIKRVEILSALKEKLPDAPEIGPEQLGKIQTLRQIVEYLGESSPAPEPDEASGDTGHTQAALLETIADKTGYPVEMLELDMALDADLGIDSIKRVEILSALKERLPDAPEIGPEQLGEIQTLRQIVEYLGAGTPSTLAAPAPSGDSELIETVLLETISEKTGYPPEMLELDMALDADLGIDSIKRVEILSILQEKLPKAAEIGPDQLNVIQTLRQIVEYLVQGSAAIAAVPQPVEETSAPVLKEVKLALPGIKRSVVRCVPMDANAEGEKRLALPANAPIWVSDDGSGLAQSIKTELTASGCEAKLISMRKLNSLSAPGALGALVIVAPAECDDAFLLNAFTLTQKSATGLRNSGGVLATVSRMDGQFGFSDGNAAFNPISGGLAGLAKTAGHEWPEVHCKAIDIADTLEDIDETARRIVQELRLAGPNEIGITTQGRFGLQLESQALSGFNTLAPLTEGDVVVVTGGARGVTAEAALALAETCKATLVLLGRSQKPHDEPAWLASLVEEAAIKRGIMARANGAITPKRLEQKYKAAQANREMLQNITRMEEAGATAKYYSVDIRDAQALQDVLEKVRRKLGPIKGIVHGAGVLADKLIEDKTAEQFEHVYQTKVGGLRALLEATRQDELKAMVMFSSSTARFGRTGQVDYAMANEVLNKIAACEAKARPACRVVSVNWGPWAGGMVTPALAKVFEAEGVGLIDLKAGARYLVDELAAQDDKPVEIVILGGTQSVNESEMGEVPPSELSKAFELTLDTDSHPFLKSHVMNGKAVAPAAVIIEWLAHGAIHANPGLRFHGLNQFKVYKGVILEKNQGYSVQVLAGKAVPRQDGYASYVELRDASGKVIHAAAEIVLAECLPKGEAAMAEAELITSDDAIYDNGRLFHGTEFQSIEAIDDCSQDVTVALAKPSPPPSKWSETPLRNAWLADPLALDSCFQMMILWSFKHYGVGSLPVKLGEYRQFRNAFPKKGVRIQAHVTEHNEHRVVANVEFSDPATKTLVARLTNYECVLDASLNEAFTKNALD